jgi:hypothetical protein
LATNKLNLINDNIKSIINDEFNINLNEIDLNSDNERFCHSCYNKFVKKLDELTKQQQQNDELKNIETGKNIEYSDNDNDDNERKRLKIVDNDDKQQQQQEKDILKI